MDAIASDTVAVQALLGAYGRLGAKKLSANIVVGGKIGNPVLVIEPHHV